MRIGHDNIETSTMEHSALEKQTFTQSRYLHLHKTKDKIIVLYNLIFWFRVVIAQSV
jgi:hypothetical protein